MSEKCARVRDIAIATFLVAVLAAILVPNFIRARAQGSVPGGCKSNLKNLATSLEMYASDNQRHYPQKLSQIAPNYLRIIPQCPSAQSDTYSATYGVAQEPDAFTVCCNGLYHTAAGIQIPNFPQYTSYRGLLLP